MFTNLFKSLDTTVKLVVRISSLEMYARFVGIIFKYQIRNNHMHYPDAAIEIIEMKHNEYLKMMKDLQANGLNLKMTDKNGLIDELVEWKP